MLLLVISCSVLQGGLGSDLEMTNERVTNLERNFQVMEPLAQVETILKIKKYLLYSVLCTEKN